MANIIWDGKDAQTMSFNYNNLDELFQTRARINTCKMLRIESFDDHPDSEEVYMVILDKLWERHWKWSRKVLDEHTHLFWTRVRFNT